MVSVERLVDYGKLEPEIDTVNHLKEPISTEWPTRGHIELKNLCLSYEVAEKKDSAVSKKASTEEMQQLTEQQEYSGGTLVLKHITCDIPAAHKVKWSCMLKEFKKSYRSELSVVQALAKAVFCERSIG